MLYHRQTRSGAGEHGAVTIKAVLVVALLGAAVFLVVKIAPVYVDEREAIFKVDELANKAAVRNMKEPEIQKWVADLEKELNLPEGSVTISSAQENRAKIVLAYTVPIDLLVTTYNWRVEHTAMGKGI
jgi:uncharacterized membrane protein